MSDDTVDLGALKPVAPPGMRRTPAVGGETCGNCRFIFKDGPNTKCRAHPPQVTILIVGMGQHPISGQQQAQMQTFSDFAPVQPEQSCGEFQLKVRQ